MTTNKATQETSRGIPTARNVDHFAFTVPNLEEAVDFFTDVLGCEVAYEIERIDDPKGEWMEQRLNVHPRAALRFVMLRVGPVTNIELYEWEAPDQKTQVPKNSDVGGHHMAIYVDDIDVAYEYLKGQPGVTVLGEPQDIDEGPHESYNPHAGTSWVYFLTPWGMQMEIVTRTRRLPYEENTSVRAYGPSEKLWNEG
jgi:catechol 2,3-dioxygenase-like lactoylglutathione lyase family enzyme